MREFLYTFFKRWRIPKAEPLGARRNERNVFALWKPTIFVLLSSDQRERIKLSAYIQPTTRNRVQAQHKLSLLRTFPLAERFSSSPKSA